MEIAYVTSGRKRSVVLNTETMYRRPGKTIFGDFAASLRIRLAENMPVARL
jgi:hypothetical protein